MEAAVTFPAPAGLDDAQAAGFVIAYQTGWFALHERARLQPGETLLVHAAAGGVGTAAVQLGQGCGRPGRRGGGRPRQGRGGAPVRCGRRRRPAYRGRRGGREGGDRRARSGRRVRPGRWRRLHAVDEVRRVRGPDRRRGVRERHDAAATPRPRPGEELLDPRPALGALRPGRPGPGAGGARRSWSGWWPTARSPPSSASACRSRGSPKASSGWPTAPRSDGSCGRRDRRPAGSGPRRAAAGGSTSAAPALLDGPLTGGAHRRRQVQPHLRGGRRHDARSSCAARRSGTCSPPRTTWGASTASSSALRDTAVPVPRDVCAVCRRRRRARRAVLRDGAGRRRALPHRGRAGGARAQSAPARSASALVDTLAELHAVDPAAVGLADFGRPEGFLARQVRRWEPAAGRVAQPRARRASTSCTTRLARTHARRRAGRRSCTATTGSTTSSSTPDDADRRGARLGDGDARRPADRRRAAA